MHLPELHLLLTGQLGATEPQPEGTPCPPPHAEPPSSALHLGSADRPAMPVTAAGHHVEIVTVVILAC